MLTVRSLNIADIDARLEDIREGAWFGRDHHHEFWDEVRRADARRQALLQPSVLATTAWAIAAVLAIDVLFLVLHLFGSILIGA